MHDKSTTESTRQLERLARQFAKNINPRRRTSAWLYRKLTESYPAVRALAESGALQNGIGRRTLPSITFSRIAAAAEVQSARRLGLVRLMCDVAEAAKTHETLRTSRSERELDERTAALVSRIRAGQ
jgi:hypothetical protein